MSLLSWHQVTQGASTTRSIPLITFSHRNHYNTKYHQNVILYPQRLDPKQQGDDVDSAKEAYRVSQDDTYLIVLPDEPVSAVGSTHSLGGPPSPENSQLYVNVPEGNHSSRPGSSHPVPPRPCEEVEGEMEYDYPNVRFGLPGHLNSKVFFF